MKEKLRNSGIKLIGETPWGTHFCQFYKTKEDLIDILVPYFKTGLENNEFCMWVTSKPLIVKDATVALKKVVKNVDKYIKKGQLEILDASQWYTKTGKFDAESVLKGWVKKESAALKSGFAGLRLTGNTFWLEKKDWKKFKDYEETVNNVIGQHKMLAICSYSLDKCDTSKVLDVVANHQFTLIRRKGNWEIIESSEQKRTEEALQESEEKFRLLTEQSLLGVVIIQDGLVKYVNQATCNITGYSIEETMDWKQNGFGRLFHPDDLKFVMEQARKNQKGAKDVIINYQYRIITKSGEVKWVDQYSKTINFEGKLGDFITLVDITERKMMEEELIKSEEKYRSLVEDAGAGIATSNLEGNLTYVNSALCKMIGYSKNELMGKPFIDFIYHDDKEKIFELFESSFSNPQQKIDLEFRVIHKKGHIGYLYTKPTIIWQNGEIAGFNAIITDITDRKRAEEVIKESEEKYRLLFENASEGILHVDIQGNIIDANPMVLKIAGCKRKDIVGKNFMNLASSFGLNSKEMRLAFKESFSKGSKKDIEWKIKNKKGKVLTVSAHPAVVKKDGEVVGLNYIIEDITTRKRTDEALRESEEKYRTLVENASDYIFMVNKKGEVLSVNTAAIKLLRKEPQEIIGKSFFNIFPKETATRFLSSTNNIIKTGISKIIEGLLKVGKEEMWVSTSLNPVKDSKGSVIAVLGTTRDITERKRAVDKLRETHEYLENLINHANAPIIVWNQVFKITRFNSAFERLTGYTADDVVGKELSILFPKASREKSLIKINNTLNGEYWESVEIPILCSDGNIRIVLWNSANIYDENGKTILVTIAQGQDITERKRAENALMESEERFRNLTDLLPEGVFEIDVNGNFLFANKKALMMSGYTQSDLEAGLNVIQMFIPDEHERVKKNISQILTGKDIGSQEYNAIKKDGTKFPVLIHSNIISQENKPMGLRGIFIDITERKRAEEALQDSEEKLRRIFESVTDGIVITNLNGDIIEINENAMQLGGHKSKNELLGSNFIDSIAPYDRNRALENMMELMQKGIKGTGEFNLIKTDGTEYPTEISASVLKDDTGVPIGFINVIRDITERKYAEEQINNSLKEKEVLLQEIHHRVKNNMQVISSLLNLQARYIKDKKTAEMFKESQNRIKSMALVHEKLYQSKDFANIDFSEYVRTLTNYLFRNYKISSSKIELKMDVKNVSIGVDHAIPCGLIINELVSNSIKHGFLGKKQGEIKIKLHSSGKNDIKLIISDNGIGLPADPDIKRSESLGLHLVNLIVEDQLQGRIKLNRAHGTEFQIQFRGVN